MQDTNTTETHKEHQHWLEELTMWHNELYFYSRILVRLAGGNVQEAVTDTMEEFKSRFDNMNAKLINMREAIEAHEKNMSGNGSPATHNEMRERVSSFEKEFKTLKNDFFTFTDREDY
jgi:predicted translin family RNA/ssDNA-binding protein